MTAHLRVRERLSYGLFGLPLALVALPVYVQVPQLYAGSLGLSLSVVGAMLLLARVLDAFIDPLLGAWMDRRQQASGYADVVLIALAPLVAGYLALFHPPALSKPALLGWFAMSLVLVYLGFSLATIAHQSWGARLTQQPGERTRLTATREAFALLGVVLAAALPAWVGMSGLSAAFVAITLAAAFVLYRFSPRGEPSAEADEDAPAARSALWLPLAQPRFRWLLAAFAVNGIAAAIPATLFLFFAADRLGLPQQAGLFLVLYFVAAALALPVWTALAARIGEARAWLISMLLAVVAFIGTTQLDAGALLPFAVICVLSGAALGADLALPPALLAGVISAAGHSGQREGAYMGLWSFATKLNLALAAGISLPLLEWLGYLPGRADANGLSALTVAYALVPCGLKLVAAFVLWRAPLRTV